MAQTEELLTAPQVAPMLSVSPETVLAWAKSGRLPSITLPSGNRRFRRADIDAILNPPAPADEPAEATS
jgi:excisionase family DNA binding protein